MKKNEIYIYVAAYSTLFLLVLSLSFTGDSNISCACRTACRIDIECGGRSSTKSVGIRLHNKSDVSTSHQSCSWLSPYLKFLIQGLYINFRNLRRCLRRISEIKLLIIVSILRSTKKHSVSFVDVCHVAWRKKMVLAECDCSYVPQFLSNLQ